MNRSTESRTATAPVSKSLSRVAPRRGYRVVVLTFALGLFVLSPSARAIDPPPDGAYPNQNTAEGDSALFHLTTGANNTAVGFQALFTNAVGSDNTAVGSEALHGFEIHRHLTGNTAVGARVLQHAGQGGFGGMFNTGVGDEALSSNTGEFNTATGAFALQQNFGQNNTATGASALQGNGGSGNTATGMAALSANGGNQNTATGIYALANNAGSFNTADGSSALSGNTTGFNNTAIGTAALRLNSAGNNNSAVGYHALQQNTGSGNVAAGAFCLQKNTTGSGNIAIGINAGSNLTTGSNNIEIAAFGVAGESGTIRIGADKQTTAYIAGIYGTTVASGVPVVVASNGQLGTVTSSARFKEAIKPMDKASEAILALKPVTFRYKEELDPDKIPQFGLIAEEVQKIDPDLVVKDDEGNVSTVRYEAVNAMLLNEFLKEHCRAEQQRKQFEEKFAEQQEQIEALTATLQKVSAQVGLSNSFPQTVANNQ